MKQSARVRQNQRHNLKLAILLQVGKLFFNLITWTIWTYILFYLIFLANPQLGTDGSKFFQLVAENHQIPVLLACFVATFSWLIEDVMLNRFLARKSLGVVFLFRILALVVVLLFVFLLVSAFHYHNKLITETDEYFILLKSFFISQSTAALFLIGVIISSIINMEKAIRQKVGAKGFMKIVSGYYRTPREEDRIFIFIDLVSSTRYAEQLGAPPIQCFSPEMFRTTWPARN